VSHQGGRLVKLIGDEAMFVVEDPVAACAVALELATHPDLPPIRVGLADGSIIAAYAD
jgi:adenylate cyclase